jgi:sugar phosphate isomerase/epimerase
VKLGLGSYAYAWAIGVPGHAPDTPMDALAFLGEARQLGVRVVQVCDNLPLATLDGRALDGFERAARDAGIDIEVGMRGLDDGEFASYLELAQRFRSPFVRTVIDRGEDRPPPDLVVERVRRLLPACRCAGVRLAIENHDRFRAATLASIVERTDPEWVGVCLDTVNSFGALEGPDVVVPTLLPYMLSLHLKDFVIERVPSQMGFVVTGAPACEGRLDVDWLVGQLRETGRDVNVVLELWPPFGPTLDDTIRRERTWVATSVRNLRRIVQE